MSKNPAFFTLRQGGPASGQASQGHGGPVLVNHGAGLGSAPRAPMHQQYQQQQQFPQQHLYQQHEQPHHVGQGLHHSDTLSQWTPDDRQRRVVEKCDIRDERMTDADMREALSSYVIYRLEKVPGDPEAPDDGRAAPPTWQNIFRTEIRDMSAQAAAQRVRELGRERLSLPKKKAALIPAQQRQVEKALEELEAAEKDTRYCFVLAQLDRQTERMSDEDYLRDERNWGRLTDREREKAKTRYYGAGEKGGKKISVAKGGRGKEKDYREKGDKTGQKKETTSITVFYKRMPRTGVDVAAMYREGMKAGPREGSSQPFRQQQSPMVPHLQPMYSLQQHQGPQYPQQPQHLQPPQNFQHPQPPQPPQHLQQHHLQQRQQGNFQQNSPPPAPPPIPQSQFPIRTKVPPPPGSKGPIPPPPPPPRTGKGKPIVVQPPAKPRKEPLRDAKVIQTATSRKAGGAREKKYPALSPRSSDSSLSDDLFSCDTGTSRSSNPPELLGDKRGRLKGRERERGRRARSESSESSRSRSRTRSRSRGRGRGRGRDGARDHPESYGVRRQHVRGDRAYVSPPLVGSTWGVPPAPPSTEPDALSPAALKTMFDLGKEQGQREAERNLEPVTPRTVNGRRVVSRTRDEGERWGDDKVYRRPGYERERDVDGGVYERGYQSVSDGVRGNDRAYHLASEGPARRFERWYHAASEDYSDGPRGNDRAYHPAPEGPNRPFERRY